MTLFLAEQIAVALLGPLSLFAFAWYSLWSTREKRRLNGEARARVDAQQARNP